METLRKYAKEFDVTMTSEEFAKRLDETRKDSLRDKFFYPKMKDLETGTQTPSFCIVKFLNIFRLYLHVFGFIFSRSESGQPRGRLHLLMWKLSWTSTKSHSTEACKGVREMGQNVRHFLY